MKNDGTYNTYQGLHKQLISGVTLAIAYNQKNALPTLVTGILAFLINVKNWLRSKNSSELVLHTGRNCCIALQASLLLVVGMYTPKYSRRTHFVFNAINSKG